MGCKGSYGLMPAKRNRKFDREYGAYLTGESMGSISRRLELARSSVGRAFRRRGFKKRCPWKVNEGQRALIVVLDRTGDYTRRVLADAFGYKSYVSITEIVNKAA